MSLVISVPEGAICQLFPDVPLSKDYSKAIDSEKVIPATCVTPERGMHNYCYENLNAGIYHCSVTMDGYNSVCQIINFTEEKVQSGFQFEIEPDKLIGKGYEAGYVMLNTQEFIDSQMASEKDTWGQEYAHIFKTPQFTRMPGCFGKHQQTTNEEIADFISKLNTETPNMHVFILGKTPKYGFDMPLVLFTKENVDGMTLEQAAETVRNNSKPTIQYCAQCHSTEPASTEGALATMLSLCGEYGNRVLDTVDLYIVPRINLDGAVESIRRSPTTVDDMNRDYLYMNNQEIRMITAAYNLFQPEVTIDGHEKGNDVLKTGESLCTDMELQVGTGALNHPAAMTKLGMDIALTGLKKAKELGLRGHFYNKFASAAGGCAGSSYFGTRNSLSFLVETPGQVHLGMHFMERRVMAHYTFASTVIDYTVKHAKEVMKTVRDSREYMIQSGAVYDENKVIVLEHAKEETGAWSTPLIDVPTGETINKEHSVAYMEHITAVRTRPRPTAYLIPKEVPHEQEILRVAKCHAISYYSLDVCSSVSVQQYLLDGETIKLTDEKTVTFSKGAYVFPNTVSSTVLGVIMEPDFNSGSNKNTLYNMGLIAVDEKGHLPIYRYCHDLECGKISIP